MVGPRVTASNLLRQTEGERFVVKNREFVFAKEFAREKFYLDQIHQQLPAKSSGLAIIYLHVSESFAFLICGIFCSSAIEKISERIVSFLFRKSSCKKIFDDYNATPLRLSE
ncbi:MAG: hypothetical protein M3447_10130 [Acidobacteriota bacterium]|nr:hypothetical protein [Acidobacteriota bacterium]